MSKPARELIIAVCLMAVAVGLWGACGASPPSVPPLSPATREALVKEGISLLRSRCTDLFATGEPPASEARDACVALQAIDRSLMVLVPASPAPSGSASPKDRDTADHAPDGPVNPTPGNAVRNVDGGG